MRHLLLPLACALPVFGQMAPQPQPTLTLGAASTLNLDWHGIEGRSYFIQSSEDLVHWDYFPAIELGRSAPLGYGFASDADKFFVRLKYTDEPTDDPENADFDGDGLNNLAEISIHHTDPFKADSDGDGLLDGWEVANGLDPNDDGSINPANGAGGDPDMDGSSNEDEQAGGTDPQSAASFPPTLVEISRRISVRKESHAGPISSGELSATASWSDLQVFTADTSLLTFATVESRLESNFPFPATIPENLNHSSRTPVPGDSISGVQSVFNQFTSGQDVHQLGSIYQHRLWIKAPALPTAQTFKVLKRARHTSQAMSSASHTVGPVTETKDVPTIETVTIPANESVSDPHDLKPAATLTNGVENWSYLRVSHVSIVPDTGMAGVVGDMVPSNKTENPELHFVSPKKTDQIPGDYVVLRATGLTAEEITPENPRQIVEWSGDGEEVDGQPLKRKFKRDATKQHKVEIKIKATGAPVVKMNVWIIWTDITVRPGEASYQILTGHSKFTVNPHYSKGWRFQFKIQPESMIAEYSGPDDIPDLRGTSSKPVPGQNKTFYAGGDPMDGAKYKWDVTRQLEVIVKNPNLIAKDKLKMAFSPDDRYKNQPVASDVPVAFPILDYEGNDDGPIKGIENDEDNFPYLIGIELGREHPFGAIASFDAPSCPILDSYGSVGYKLQEYLNFREFARVELWDRKRSNGQFWYRISDFKPWHHVMKAHFTSAGDGDWANDGSSSGLGYKYN